MRFPISVVLATYNRRPILERTLDALEAQTCRDLRVVVVDDGSTDDTWPWLEARAAEDRDIPLIVARQENSGQGAARNRALRNVEGGYVLFLGDDIIAHPELVAEHLAAHEATSGQGAAVGFTDWCRDAMKVTPLLEMINREGHQFGYAHMQAGETVPFTCFYTSNLSIHRDLLGEAPFDGAFSAYGWEDVELGYRLSQHDIGILYHPAARAEHLHPMDLSTVFARQRTVGRGIHVLLGLHPELEGSRHLAPPQPPRWFGIGRHVVPPLIPFLGAIDRLGIPLGKRLLHRVLMCAYYLGQAEGRRPEPQTIQGAAA